MIHYLTNTKLFDCSIDFHKKKSPSKLSNMTTTNQIKGKPSNLRTYSFCHNSASDQKPYSYVIIKHTYNKTNNRQLDYLLFNVRLARVL